MLRLLVEDVTLRRDDQIGVHVRFKGGQTTSLTLDLPLAAPDARRTSVGIVAEVDRLLDDHPDAGVAAALSRAGLVSSTGLPFTAGIVHHIRSNHGLPSREQRLRARGLVGLNEAAGQLGVCTHTVKKWHREGRLAADLVNDKGSHFYQLPPVPPLKKTGRPPKKRPSTETHLANTPGGAV